MQKLLIKGMPNLKEKVSEILCDLEVERAVLAELIHDPKYVFSEIENVNIETNLFFSEANKNIFFALKNLFNEGKSIDLLTLRDQLNKSGKLESAGGIKYLAQIQKSSIGSANIKQYVIILLELSARRFLKSLSNTINRKADDPKIDVLESLDYTVDEIMRWESGIVGQDYVSIKENLREEIALQESRQKNKGMTGISTGIKSLDDLTDGWQKDHLSILAARPSVGKTALLLTWMVEAAKAGKSALFFSLEMGQSQIRKRILAQYTDISNNKLKKGNLTPTDWEKLYRQSTTLVELPIYTDATAFMSLSELRMKARKLKFRDRLDIIFIDYLQLMGVNDRRFPNREQEIAYISRSLKSLAIELGVPIVVGSQLSRAIESRGNFTFKLSDLRESGAIEQDADNVMFLHRPAAHGITTDLEGNDISQSAELHLLKQRDGETGKVHLHFQAEKMLFVNQPH